MNNYNPNALTSTGGGIDNKRVIWLDILKGIAIFFVVLGHFQYNQCDSGIKTAIYGFHMSLFFTLAGCTAAISASQSSSIQHFVSKRFVSVFIPYTTWSFLGGLQYATIEDIQHYSFIRHLHTFVCGDVMQWFLICLFILQLIYALYKRLTIQIKHQYVKALIGITLFMALFISHRIWGRTSDDVPYWTLESITNAYIYFIPFALGVILIEYPKFFDKIFQSKFAIFLSVILTLFCIRLYANIPSNHPRSIIGICVSILIIMLVRNYDFEKLTSAWGRFVSSHMILFGKYTLVIYLFHSSLLPNSPLSDEVWGNGILPFIIMVVIAWAVCYICIAMERLISQSPLCALLLLGKKRT